MPSPRHRSDKADKRAFVSAAKAQPCTDCGERFPYYVMEFDHLPGTDKLFNLSKCANYSWDAIHAEIAKCEVVCANCHRFRTHWRDGDC